MTDYLNPHRIYPDNISRRIDVPPGFDSERGIKPMEYKSARIAEDDLPVGATVKESLTVECAYCQGWKINNAYGIQQDKAGRWCLEIAIDHCEFVVIQNIKFCPSCGRKLEERK